MRGAVLFEKACAVAVRIWPIDAARVQGRRRAIFERVRSLDSEIEKIEQSVQFEPKIARERDVQARSLQRLRGRRDREKAVLEQPSFHRALEATRLNVTLETVLRLGRIAALAVAASCVVVLAGALARGLPTSVVLVLGVFVLVAPVAAYVLVLSYPEGLARRMRVASLGSAPEAVNYMAMSMRVVPSLDRAIEFAAHHTEEPLASRLRQVLWSVYLRSPPGVEAAFLRFAAEWGEWQEDVKRALFALASASLEQTDAGLDRTLEKARQIAFEGTRARIMEYSAGLRGPTTVLFALGVLLPVIIGAMLPLVSLGGLTPSLAGSPGPSPGADVTLPAVLAMDVLFPLGAFAYAYRILGSRPGTGSALDFTRPSKPRHLLVSVALLIAAIPAFGLASSPLVSFVGLWLVVAAAVVYLVPGLRDFERRRRAIAKLEAEFPDALFILGSRIAEGTAAEKALQMTVDTTRGSEVSALLGRVLRALQMSRQGLEEVLFSRSGVLRDVPSRAVHAAFRMVVEVSRKDPATAGKTIVETSAYLRDLRDIDREIHRDLSSVVDAMQTTGAFFAPIVLGVTCALYGLLTRAFSSIVVLGMSPVTFLGVVGVYMLLAVAVITYFRVGIAHGRDPIEVRVQLAKAWPVSMAVFTVAFLVSELGLS